MTTQISTQTISFNKQALITFEQNGTHYTAMKPICENIGLDWTAQAQRLKRDEILNSTMVIITIVAEDGKQREMICLPIEYINGWLFGIDINRCKPEIRETLIKYKKECFQALHDYWFKGKAERSQNSQQIAPLASPKPAEKIFTRNIINHEAVDLAWLWFEANQMAGFIKEMTPALKALGSSYAPRAHSIAYEYGRHLHDIGKLVYRLTAEADFGHNPRPMRELENHFVTPTKSKRIAKF